MPWSDSTTKPRPRLRLLVVQGRDELVDAPVELTDPSPVGHVPVLEMVETMDVDHLESEIAVADGIEQPIEIPEVVMVDVAAAPGADDGVQGRHAVDRLQHLGDIVQLLDVEAQPVEPPAPARRHGREIDRAAQGVQARTAPWWSRCRAAGRPGAGPACGGASRASGEGPTRPCSVRPGASEQGRELVGGRLGAKADRGVAGQQPAHVGKRAGRHPAQVDRGNVADQQALERASAHHSIVSSTVRLRFQSPWSDQASRASAISRNSTGRGRVNIGSSDAQITAELAAIYPATVGSRTARRANPL